MGTRYERLSRITSMLLVALGETIAGLILAALLPLINEHPHILALYPVMAAARGNIYASLGSRVSSKLHLGVFDASKPLRVSRREAPRILFQSIVSASVSATIAYAALVFAEKRLVDPLEVYATALLTPLILAPPMTLFTVYTASLGFRRGLDPDTYLTPVVTLACDLAVLPAVVTAALIAAASPIPSLASSLAVAAYTASRLSPEDRRVFAENTGAVLVGSLIELLRSYMLVAYLPFLNSHPYILAMLPTFNAENGAALGAVASRVSTRLHLGLYESSPLALARDAIQAYTSSLAAYTLTAALIALSYGSPEVLASLLLVSAAAGAAITSIMTVVTHLAAVLGFQKGLDPDNIVVPLVTTLTDTLGTIIFLTLAAL